MYWSRLDLADGFVCDWSDNVNPTAASQRRGDAFVFAALQTEISAYTEKLRFVESMSSRQLIGL
jgi:hypothetical protein